MEMQELESLEQKTRAIVETLAGLEKEVEIYQDKNLQINEAFKGIKGLSGKLSKVGSNFLSVIELLKKGDFAQTLNALDAKIKEVESLYQRVDDAILVLTEKQNNIDAFIVKNEASTSKALSDVQRSLARFDEKISRIDRNSQKTFRKEKG